MSWLQTLKNAFRFAPTPSIDEQKTAVSRSSNKLVKQDSTPALDISSTTIIKFWVIGAAVVFAAYILFQSLEIVYLILTAYIISIALEAIIMYLYSKGMSRGMAIWLTYLLFIVFVLSGFVFIVPFLVGQLSTILESVVNSVAALQNSIATQGIVSLIDSLVWLPGYAKDSVIRMLSDANLSMQVQQNLQNNISQLVGLGSTYIQNLGNFAVNLVSWFVVFVTKAFVTLTLAILFSVEKKSVMKFVASLWGASSYDYAYAKLDRIYAKLGLWLKGQLILCIYIGIIVYCVLQIMGWIGLDLSHKWSLALIGWLTEFVPYIGPILWGIPAALLALVSGYGIWGFFIVGLVYWFIQWTENNILIPVVMHQTLGINPVVIFICVLLGGFVMWFIGIVIGVPLAVIISMLYSHEE